MKTLVVPSEIPWAEMRGEVLEQFLYWLLDDMGAKDLEWRKGGNTATSADGGRDLEASFYTAAPDGEMHRERWWIQAKGRSKTVEPSAIKDFVTTAEAFSGIDVLVIATNTQFSNPTRDWLKDWQAKHPNPKIRLWDKDNLERLAVQHPSTVARNYPKALSAQGALQAVTTRFWNQLQYPTEEALTRIWDARQDLDVTSESMITLVGGEINNNTYWKRPWLARIEDDDLILTVATLLSNFPYFVGRVHQLGVDQQVLMNTVALVVSTGLTRLPDGPIFELILSPLSLREGPPLPATLNEMIVEWILDSIKQALRPSCVADCVRVSADEQKIERFDLLTNLRHTEPKEEPDQRHLIIEHLHEPCNAGLPLNPDRHCPLFNSERTAPHERLSDYAVIIRNRLNLLPSKNPGGN